MKHNLRCWGAGSTLSWRSRGMGRYSHDIHSESFWYIWYIWYLLISAVWTCFWLDIANFFMMWLWKSYWDCGGPPEAQQGLARSLGRLGGRLDINWHRLDVQLDIQLSPLGTKVLVIESLIRHWCQIWPRFWFVLIKGLSCYDIIDDSQLILMDVKHFS